MATGSPRAFRRGHGVPSRAEALPPRAYPFVADEGCRCRPRRPTCSRAAPGRGTLGHRFDRACRNGPIARPVAAVASIHRQSPAGKLTPPPPRVDGIDPIRSHEKDSFARWRPEEPGSRLPGGGDGEQTVGSPADLAKMASRGSAVAVAPLTGMASPVSVQAPVGARTR